MRRFYYSGVIAASPTAATPLVNDELAVAGVDLHDVALAELALEDRHRERSTSCFWMTRLSGRAP